MTDVVSSPRSPAAPNTPPVVGESQKPSEFGNLDKGFLRGRRFAVARWFCLRLLWLLFGYRVSGTRHVPRSGGLIVVSNHLNNADPVLIEVAVPRPVHFMAKKEIFAVPVLKMLVEAVGAFPVDRGRSDRRAIRRADATLAQGIALGMFPEGTRSVTATMHRAHPGVGMLALRSGAPVLPVAITGSERLPFNGKKGSFGRYQRGVHVRIGESFVISRTEDGQRITAEDATERIMGAIAELLPESYRGDYGQPDSTTPSRSSSSSSSSSSPIRARVR